MENRGPYLGNAAAGNSDAGNVVKWAGGQVGAPSRERRRGGLTRCATSGKDRWVRDTYTSRSLRSSDRKSGNVAEVFGEQAFEHGAGFLKLSCGFQDNWKSGRSGAECGWFSHDFNRGAQKGLWKQG